MRSNGWSLRDDAILRRAYAAGRVDISRLTSCLGRTVSAVRARAKRLRLGADRAWSVADATTLRDGYGRVPVGDLAARLGRTVKAVHQQAQARGLTRQNRTLTPDRADRVRALVGDGHCNSCVAVAVGSDKGTVRRWRRRLGLPPVGSRGMSGECPACVARVREATREQCRRAGVSSLAEVKVKAFAGYASENGWPADLAPRCVQILNVLARGGALTRRQLADAIGLPWIGSRKSLCSSTEGGSYLATLQRRGLVVTLGRANTGGGNGSGVRLYALSAGAMDLLQRRSVS